MLAPHFLKAGDGLHFRNAALSIHVEGTGSRIKKFSVNGRQLDMPLLPADIQGQACVSVEMT